MGSKVVYFCDECKGKFSEYSNRYIVGRVDALTGKRTTAEVCSIKCSNAWLRAFGIGEVSINREDR